MNIDLRDQLWEGLAAVLTIIAMMIGVVFFLFPEKRRTLRMWVRTYYKPILYSAFFTFVLVSGFLLGLFLGKSRTSSQQSTPPPQIAKETVIVTTTPQPPPSPERVEVTRIIEVPKEVKVNVEVTRIVSPTPGSPQPTPEPIIHTKIVVVTPTPSPVVATQVSASSPEPTETIVAQPAPTEGTGVLFEDDFDTGLSPEWQILSGEPVLSNESLTTGGEVLLIVGDSSWADYTVEFDVLKCPRYKAATIYLRLQDPDNMIAFVCELGGPSYWQVVKNGNWQEVANTRSGVGRPPGHCSTTVEGDKFTAYFGVERVSSFFDSTFQQGKVGLKLGTDVVIDNFRISSGKRND